MSAAKHAPHTPIAGDAVRPLDGDYQSATLTLLRRDNVGRYVLGRTSWPYEVTANNVQVIRVALARRPA